MEKIKTVPITIRIPENLVRCAVEYARHHDLHSRNAAINVALEAFFRNLQEPPCQPESADRNSL